jgi:biopolymer transport protein ExbB/TolQ
MGVDLLHLWGTMGWFAKGIVYLLLFMSIMVMSIAAKKIIELRKARKATLKFMPKFSTALKDADFSTAQRLVDEHPQSHLASAFRRVFPSLTFHSQDHALSAAEISSVQRLIDLNSIEQVARFRRGLGVLATIGATAPFVGLLGTTMGVVNAFAAMGVGGGGGLEAISAGISEALITTAFGLFVALPAVWLYNYFINRIDYVSMEITYATKEFVDFLLRYEAKLHGSDKSGLVLELEHAQPHSGARAATSS